MKKIAVLLAAATLLAACDQRPAPAPYVAPPVQAASGAPAPEAAPQAADLAALAALLGAGAGYLMGRSNRQAAAPAPAIVERHTVIVREVPRVAPPPRFSPPPVSRTIAPSPARVSSFRPSASFGRRR